MSTTSAFPEPSAPRPTARPASAVLPEAAATEGRLGLLEALLETLPLGVSVRAPDGRCILANAAAVALTGTTAAMAGSHETAPVRVQGGMPHRSVETRVHTLHRPDGSYAVETAVDVTEQRRLERNLFDRAFLDELTGLPNRGLIQQSTEDLIASAAPGIRFALAFIDLDNFKHINDYYSHAVGDALLVKIGARLSTQLGPDDLVARIGGDEFVILLTGVADRASLKADVDAFVDRLKQPFFIDGHEIFASASVGVSLYPDHGRSFDTLHRNADSAMYRIKNGTKGGAVLFDKTMEHAATTRMALEQRLRLAIRDRRFCCAFQPKVDLRSHAVVGLEVLLRWRDEQGLIQAPGDFVALAVELGLINEIAHLVLTQTMGMIDKIDAAFGPDVSISFNVAAKQADDLGFMRSYIHALVETGCPERFMLELTEEAFFTKSRFQAEVLPRLRRIGTRVSIDDFGVGYSSLSALADISVDEIKIDRSFITDIHKRPRSQCVLRAIESLSHGLGMSMVAEGVETFEELAYLQTATRIGHAQGYYFAKPMLLDHIERSLILINRPQASLREPIRLRDPQDRVAVRGARA